ncbi:sensor histidine kinase [Agromyces sp. MMS24-K17]|uniref:sensor histidine kinase n=1 Tax=Agromyces sp. MMS24-K17 TaxID=3372850 RepID=UPI0037540D5D
MSGTNGAIAARPPVAWPVLPASMARTGRGSIRTSMASRAAVSWYVGAGISLLWMGPLAEEVIATSTTEPALALGLLLVAVYGLAFVAAGPVVWALPSRGRLAVVAGLWAYTLVFTPWLGWAIGGIWTYVGVIVGMCVFAWRRTLQLLGALAACSLGFGFLALGPVEEVLAAPALLVAISLMMAAFARNLAAMNQLRATQDELERMAVEQERGRVARDIHDILGHSLTVITVKAELAGRLAAVDPDRAAREIGEVEDLARGALADVRATVAGFRGVSVSGELAAARSALESAGIVADLPVSTEQVPADRRELAGWIVREGVTNVLRHSDASTCRIRLEADSVEVADDGRGPVAASSSSTGLAGLRERVEAARGRLVIGRSDLGGFCLRAEL